MGEARSGDAASSGFGRFIQIPSKSSKGSGSFRGTIEIHASVIRHLEESGQMYVNVMLVQPIGGKAANASAAKSCRPFLSTLATVRISLSPTHIGHQATPNATLRPRGPLVI
jgi:hypothetical protein